MDQTLLRIAEKIVAQGKGKDTKAALERVVSKRSSRDEKGKGKVVEIDGKQNFEPRE